MKNTIFILTISLFLLSCNKKETIIYNPEFESSNSESIQLSKIELTDTATILYVDVYNRPGYWIKISSETILKGEERTYKLTGSEGFELDKEVYMPESGNVSFTLFFEPVNKQEKYVDFIENEGHEHYKIDGIKLYHVKESAKNIRCVLKGEVVDRPYSSRLILSKEGEDVRTAKVVYIPIRDGQFEYILNCDAEESYELTFYDEHMQGGWRPSTFIAENGTVNFTLHPMEDFDKNVIKGGIINDEKTAADDKINEMYKAVMKEQEKLMSEERFYTKIAAELREQIENMENNDPKRGELIERYNALHDSGKDLTGEAKTIESKWEEASKQSKEIKLRYAKENPTVVGYNIVLQDIRIAIQQARIPGRPAPDITSMVDLYKNLYKGKYPGHPYTLHIEQILTGESVKVGNPYIDVTATDPEGKEVKLSKLIDGKVAMIHLWASWCGPCRRHGKELIPIYEQYKDKGFTVAGIARENNRDAMIKAKEKDGYPWIDLLELNDRDFIWTKYGIGNAGGGDFLVDAQGKIVAISPDTEEIHKILKELLDE